MAVNSTNRETIRDAIAALLDTALVDTLGIVQAVYGYQKGSFDGESPIVLVLSSGDQPDKEAVATRVRTRMYFEIWTYTLHSDLSSWTEANAEDRMDQIKKEITDTIMDNQVETDTGTWDLLFEERSTVSRVSIGGVPYLWEVIPLTARAWSS